MIGYAFGHETGESLIDGSHSQFKLSVVYIMLKSYLSVKPLFAHTALKMSDVAHPHPREMRGTGEIVAYLLICQSELFPDSGENGLASDRRERHIESVHSHPVNLFFPLFPPPERSGVAESAHIVIKMMLIRTLGLSALHCRQLLGKIQPVARPAHETVAVGEDVVVKTFAYSHGRTALNRQSAFSD